MKLIDLLETAGILSDEFINWFGDSRVGSKYNAKIVYHGSPDGRDIDSSGIFKMREIGDNNAIFFSDKRSVAKTYANDHRAWDYQNAVPKIYACYLKIENPLIVDAERKKWRETEHHIDIAKNSGYDGIIIKNSYDEYNAGYNERNGALSTVYGVFSSNQIKSINNDGTFDADDPNIFS